MYKSADRRSDARVGGRGFCFGGHCCTRFLYFGTAGAADASVYGVAGVAAGGISGRRLVFVCPTHLRR